MGALPEYSSGVLLRRHLTPFVAAFALLTAWLLASSVTHQLPRLLSSGAPVRVIGNVLALSVCFIVPEAMPLAIFIAVVYVFSHLVKEAQPVQVLRLARPVFLASVVIAGLALCWTSQVLPRSNYRLRQYLMEIMPHSALVASPDRPRSDREMTLRELREAVHAAREAERKATARGSGVIAFAARRRAAAYAVEIQKKYALAAACVLVVLLGVPLGLRLPGGGWWLALVASVPVSLLYYLGLVGGEKLGDRLVVSPFLAMWVPDLLIGAVGIALLWWSVRTLTKRREGDAPTPRNA